MGYKSKRKRTKSRNVYTRRNRCKVTRRKKGRFTRKMKGGGKGKGKGDSEEIYEKNRQLIGLASNLKNAMFEYNKKNFNKGYLQITIFPKINVSEFITEKDIDIVGPDFDPIRDDALQYVLKWHNDSPDIDITPWNKFVGKLCEVPPGFFANNPAGNLQNVKNNPANFNQNFPRDPTNANIVEIQTYILGLAQNGRAMNSAAQPIIPGKYKFVLMADKDNTIRYIPDTGNRAPYYYFPSIMLYFYNIGVITFGELKQSLGNELPHSLLFNPRIEAIMGAGDFTVDQNGSIVELTGYSGHTKPLPSNVALSAYRFKDLEYLLELVRTNEVRLQTGNTDRNDLNNRLIGSYLNNIYRLPKKLAAAATMQPAAAALSDEEA
jgi:hypothetical protein